MSQLKLYLFGAPKIEIDDKPINLPRRKSMALLIYLVATRQPQRRDALVTMLWPESGQQTARASLRRELHHLNQIIGDEWLNPTRDAIELASNASIWLDVGEFQEKSNLHLPTDTDRLTEDDLASLAAAAKLYQADFMKGFTLSGCPDFDEWQFFEGDALRQQFARLLRTLSNYHAGQSEFEEAIGYTRRWLALDDMHEPGHRELMRLFALAGQQAAAVRQYDECVRILAEELGVSPEEETTSLYEAIRTRRFSVHGKSSEQQDGSIRDASELPATSISRHPFKAHNLPRQPTSFIGRKEELSSIRRLLRAEDGCRLLTLIGPGGIGKTRLAIEAASDLVDAFPDGIYFVPLVSIDEVENIFTMIAEAMHFSLQGGDPPKAQICSFLGERKLLFVLDNFEHLLGGAVDLGELLHSARNVSVLVTSRVALGLQEEWLYPVSGMGLPTKADALSTIEANASVRLFVERARRAKTSFAVTQESKFDLIRICQAVDGLPLGLELAASWLRALSCEEIAEELTQNLDLLETNIRNIPERHRSVRIIFDQTWQQISPREQQVLAALSLFRGGCTRDAAGKVASASLPLIMQMVDKSLLQRSENGRYQMHELFRQYVFAKLQETPDIHQQLLAKLSNYFADYIHSHQANLEGGHQREVLRHFVADMDNIRLAWQIAIDHDNLAALWKAAEGLCIFTDMHCSYLDGIALFGQAIDALTEQGAATDGTFEMKYSVLHGTTTEISRSILIATMQVMQGFLLARAALWNRGIPLVEEGIDFLRADKHVDQATLARALMRFCHFFPRWQSKVVEELERLRDECLSLAEPVNDRWCIASCLYFLGNTMHWSGNGDRAIGYLQECLRIFKELGDEYCIHRPYLNLAVIANNQGNYERALAYFAESIRLCQATNNLVDEAFILALSVDAHVATGDVDSALEAGRTADQILTELGLVEHQKVRGNLLAEALRVSGHFDEAEELHLIALQRAEEVGEENIIADTYRRLARVEWARQDYRSTEEYLSRSISLSQKNDNRLTFVYSLRDMGLMLIDADSGRKDEIRAYLQEALQLALALDLAPVALDTFLGEGILKTREEHHESARELLSFVEQHSASTYAAREKARAQLATIGDRVVQHELDGKLERPDSMDWQLFAQRLIA